LDIEGNARVAAIVLDVGPPSAAALVVDAGEHVGFGSVKCFGVWLFKCMSAVVCVEVCNRGLLVFDFGNRERVY